MAERKKYITVEIPILRSDMRILGTPEELNNKTIKLDLTRKMRGKGLTMKLRIFNLEGKLFAFPDKMGLTISYIKRMMRKRTSYIEDSFEVRTADAKVTIKPFLITRKKVSRAVRKNLRNTTKEFILEYSKDREYIEICKELLEGNMQKALLPKLKKVYPLSFCDIRIIETKELSKIDLQKASTEEVEKEIITEEIIEETKDESKEDEEEINNIEEEKDIKEEAVIEESGDTEEESSDIDEESAEEKE